MAGSLSEVKYMVISPCRDEAGFARRAIESVLCQTKPPDAWIIVDDGSTDETPAIVGEYAKVVPNLRVVRLARTRGRRVGPGVVEAFYSGFRTVDPREFKYVCKLDLDLELPPGYFEGLIRRMEADPRLGTCSGKAYYRARGNRLVSEGVGDEMSVGATKFYRTVCFLDIGGFVPEIMWDGIDCHRCRMKGWSARSFSDPDLRFLHLRPMGSSQGGLWSGRWRHGLGQWFMGTGFIFMTASAIYRMTKRPFITGGLAMWLGYVAGMVTRKPRYADSQFRAFLRRYQRNCLLVGKRRATNRLEGQNTPWAADQDVIGSPRLTQPTEVHLEGLRLHAIDEAECVRLVIESVVAGRGGWIVTPNLDHLRRLRRDVDLRNRYARADLSVADGMPLVWACRLQGTPLPGRVAGSDLIWSLSRAAAERRFSLFLIGGAPGAAEEAATRLRSECRGLRVLGILCPEPGFENDRRRMDEIAARVSACSPDIVFVALGSPKQEMLIEYVRRSVPSAWWLGVGIGFSFVAGRVKRAPPWIRKSGFEWLHRMLQEPGRLWRRYVQQGLPFGVALIARSAMRGLRSGRKRQLG